MNIKVNKKNGIRLKTKNKLLKDDIVITVDNELIKPEGRVEIKSKKEYDVTQYATARISSDTLIPENITKGVNILGVNGVNDSSKYKELWLDFLASGIVYIRKDEFGDLTSLRDYVFSYSNAYTIELPDTITSIGEGLCNRASALNNFTLSSNITELPDTSFNYCSSLRNLYNHKQLTKIGNFAFDHCSELSSTLVFNEGLTYIGKQAFYCCYRLKIILPASLNHIGDYAFYNVGTKISGRGVYFKGENPPAELPSGTFLGGVKHVYVPTGSLAAYQEAFVNSGFTGTWHEMNPEDMK